MLDVDSVIDVLATLAEEEKLMTTVKSSIVGGLVTGTAATLGGLLMGPVGMAVGGTVGGTISYLRSRNQFCSVAEILVGMEDKQKQRLYDDTMSLLQSLAIEDMLMLHAVMNGNDVLRKQLLDKVVFHVRDKLHLELCDT